MTISSKYFFPKTATLIAAIVILAFIIGFSINPIKNYFAKKEVAQVNEILNSENDPKTLDQCKVILNFNKAKAQGNEFFNESLFDKVFKQCDENYNLVYVDLNEDNCRFIISEPKAYFKRNYVFYDNLSDKRNECIGKFLVPTFSTGSFFNIDNDFKSSIAVDFNLAFFRDIGDENSDEFLRNREEAKERFANLIRITPEIPLDITDIYLYPNRALLNLNLEPLTQYTIEIASYDVGFGQDTKRNSFTFITPENRYFGMRVLNPLTLYTKANLPTFQLIDYNTPKMRTNVQICPIGIEEYAKVEVYLKTGDKKAASEFFKTGIVTCENDGHANCEAIKEPAPKEGQIRLNNCITKELIYKDSLGINKNEFVRVNIEFGDIIQDENPTGLYIVRFPNAEDIEFNGRLNKPILFGVINSHVTMKVSRTGEGFFFVNDFNGKPLANQEITVYLNDFQELNSQWNDTRYDYDVTYNLPIKGNVFSDGIVVGKTGSDGVLKVDLKEKISDYFSRTFVDEWSFNWNGVYRSFFVTSKDETHRSYLTSTWNAGIAPWNFGYTTDWTMDENQIQLTQWGDDRLFNAHIYTDRVLYLPGEEVNIKTVIRNREDLSIPANKEFTLKVNNSRGEEILSKDFKVNEFGSYAETLALRADFPLGSYSISLSSGDSYINWGGFNVEVFKNPKFTNEVSLETVGLNGELVNITDEVTALNEWGYNETSFKGNFTIKGSVILKYYNGGVVKNVDFTYRVYRQMFYDMSYWDNCYYGCFWEPSKEFYTEGKGRLDGNGFGTFEIPVEFSSNYSDYRYIVEITVTDSAGDTISGSNSIIARLPNEYKRYNNQLDIYFESASKFAKVGEKVNISGGLSVGNWTKDYNNKFIFVIKRKEYLNTLVKDVNGFERNVQKVNEIVDKVLLVNYDNFKLNGQGKLELNHKLDKNAEYVFEYGAINNFQIARFLGMLPPGIESEWDLENSNTSFELDLGSIEKVVRMFNENDGLNFLEHEVKVKTDSGTQEELVTKKLNLSDLISSNKYFTIVTYDNSTASNPIENDNKLRVIAEKVSYSIGEKARVLVRLPYSNTKVLWTIEKNGVTEYEYIDVPGNVFFKEFVVDDSFAPNAYIGVGMIPTNIKDAAGGIAQYKVGYTEIVIDKTDRKSFVEVKSNKETYKPREEVTLDLQVKNGNGKAVPSELTVMVVDDSLISLMGNVDLNTLEKIFVKLPFSVQTSLTNIAMLKNYYFSRIGIVGGSGDGNLKGGDSAVSTRNIFKNTAYFNPSVITDKNGKAQVKFTLPDNLTNFRVMVVSNSKDNHFGYSEKFIGVRKNVIAEDRTPLILRSGDNATIGANIFNNSSEDLNFKVTLSTYETSFLEFCSSCIPEQNISLKAGESKFVSWDRIIPVARDEIKYTISVIGNSTENSDKIENTIRIAEDPTLIRNIIKRGEVLPGGELPLSSVLPKNTDPRNTIVELMFSNSRLAGIEKIIRTLIVYPYGCLEQTVSSTLPNVIVMQFKDMFAGMFDMAQLQKNIDYGVDRILSMQNSDGGFVYWQGNSSSDLHITPYVLRSLVYMKNAGVNIPQESIDRAVKYLKDNVEGADNIVKAEIYWALASIGEKPSITLDVSKLERHDLIAWTYGKVLQKDTNREEIRSLIEKIKASFSSTNSYWYWDVTADKAIFASLLLDFGDKNDEAYIEELINDLYSYDWDSFWYSTQSKNNAFIAFHKYLTKTGVDNVANFSYSVNASSQKQGTLGGKNPNILKVEVPLNEILSATDVTGEEVKLTVKNTGNTKVYVNYIIKQFPLNKTEVEPYVNGMQVKREIYEVLDENMLSKCSDNYWYVENKVDCDKVLKLKTDNVFTKGALYKATVTSIFPDERTRRNLTLEDYLPGTFRVINSGFRTESASITGASTDWRWTYLEYRPDVVMGNSAYAWSKENTLEYYFRPEFEGTYLQPPVVGYLMYNPEIRASGTFREVEVK